MLDNVVEFPKKEVEVSKKKLWRCEVAVYYPRFTLEADSYDECMDIIAASDWTHGEANFDIEEIKDED